MIGRKRLLSSTLVCLLSLSNAGTSFATDNNINASDSINDNNKNEERNLNESQIYELMIECLNNADSAIQNMRYDKSSGYLSLPLCGGFFSTNAAGSPDSICHPDFINRLVVEMMLSIFVYHLNIAHMMSPEERKSNWESISVKIARWLGEGRLPEGTQNSYAFWTRDNAELFNICQQNAAGQAYNLAEEFLKNYDDMYGTYTSVFSRVLRNQIKNRSNNNVTDNKHISEENKNFSVTSEDDEQIKSYINDQINKAYEHIVFLEKSNYMTLPICDGYWATNLYCSPELVQDSDFSRGVVIDIILSIFMFALNKTYHMSPQEREENKDTIYVKIARWLGEGKLPDGIQNSFEFWDNAENLKLFNLCQCNACDWAYNLMERHFSIYESQHGPDSIKRIFESFYANSESDESNSNISSEPKSNVVDAETNV